MRVIDGVRVWASDLDPNTIEQAAMTGRLPILAGPLALMPDAHVGMGATVGSVIPTKGAIIPAAVGVDIGCGMIAAKTNLQSFDLPDNLDGLVDGLHTAIPAGVGKGHESATKSWGKWYQAQGMDYTKVVAKLIGTAAKQFGSLGSGNHFAEVCLDEDDGVWLVLHSGSRGLGNKAASEHIERARSLHRELGTRLEDKDLAYFMEEWPAFTDYMRDLLWCQAYAAGNREAMMAAFVGELRAQLDIGFQVTQTVNCHHNYSSREYIDYDVRMDGFVHERKVWVTRKGAIDAHGGVWGVIPGSMGTRSYVVQGRGNPWSYNSCSHGAGRRMSRAAARRNITHDEFIASMAGVTSWQRDSVAQLLDEAPASYKDIDQVMRDQEDLVTIRHTLHQVANYKGVR